MRTAETILSVIRKRGKEKQPCERIYRLLFNRNLYLRAYANIYSNQGAMTPGITTETADAMSLDKIDTLIEDIRTERFKWTPVKRVYIPKKNGKKRPLGIPTWKDKLVQEVLRLILESYYEGKFWKYSHGFRPSKGCHTALREIQKVWKGTTWFIEGDIESYFDTIDHDVLLQTLAKDIQDNRFLNLIQELLKAGYMEEWRYYKTYSGTPQGGIVSPLLANIYLNEFDRWVAEELIPSYTVGKRRATNLEYHRITSQLYRIEHGGQVGNTNALRKQMKQLPSQDTHDPNYRRLFYVRYADDTLFGFIGPKLEANEIKQKIAEWLKDHLKLRLSEDKTLITNAHAEKAHFLGYEINTTLRDYQLDSRKSRNSNNRIALRIPGSTIEKYVAKHLKDGEPSARLYLTQDSDFDIVTRFQSEYRGIVNYYIMADNVSHLSKLQWFMENALVRTLATKHKTTVQKIIDKHKSAYEGKPCLEVTVSREKRKPLTARFGAIELKTNKEASISDTIETVYNARSEIIQRLLAEECEVCGSKADVEVHHVRKLSDLRKRYQGKKEIPSWVKVMAARNRKTLMVCRVCHVKIHGGQPLVWNKVTGEPDASKDASPVRGGVVSGVYDS